MADKEYAVYSSGCCEEHGGPEMDYFSTLEEAEKFATKGDLILHIIKEV